MVAKRRTGSIVYLVIFLSICFMTMRSGTEDAQGFSETRLRLCIADKAQCTLSKELTAAMQKKHMVSLLDGTALSEDALLKKVRKDISLGIIDAALIIRKDVEKKILKGEKGLISIKDARRPAAYYIDSQAATFLRFALATKAAQGVFGFERVHNALAVETKVILFEQKNNTSDSVGLRYFFNFLGWAVFSLIINSIGWAVFELQDERLRIRTAVSPVSNMRFALENFTAQLTVVAVFLAILIGFATLMYRHTISSLPLASYALNAAVYTAVVLSAIFMLNAVLKEKTVMGIIGTMLPMVLAFISGIFLDQQLLPESIKTLAQGFPTYYYVCANGFTEQMLRPDWKNIGMQLLFLLLYFTLGVYFSRLNRSRRKIEFAQK